MSVVESRFRIEPDPADPKRLWSFVDLRSGKREGGFKTAALARKAFERSHR